MICRLHLNLNVLIDLSLLILKLFVEASRRLLALALIDEIELLLLDFEFAHGSVLVVNQLAIVLHLLSRGAR